MSRDPSGGRSSRWDSDRFVRERERERSRDRFEELLQPQRGGGALVTRPRERSVDETYERRVGPGGRFYEDERYKERDYYAEPPRQPFRPRRESVTIKKEREREVYSPSPPRRVPEPPRPGLIRRQSSLDTFDRRPLPRYEREYRAPRPVQRRYEERDYEDIKIGQDDDSPYRPYPERVLEREIIRSRRRSRSKESRARSISASSSSSEASVRREFPKRGKTRMPSRLVSIKAIIDLGYPYERDGEVIVIQKALGPENIDEVIKLSEIYKRSEKVEMSGGRNDDAGEIIEERREVVRDIPPRHGHGEIIEKTTFDRRELMRPPLRTGRSHSAGPAPRIIDASPAEYVERFSRNEVGPLVLSEKRHPSEIVLEKRHPSEIVLEQRRPSEVERTTLKVEPNRSIEIRKAEIVRRDEIIRRDGRSGDLIVLEESGRDRRRRYSSAERVEVRRDKKAAQARAISTMMKTLT